ncbi:hypothetical protein E3N88_45308 [Mikania micrantha]|uniref:Uncharacterized protein n=1 Tax=Mikania micrantha TaxID=192012 RepID=A0A5N6LA65_9ASTR|nr:hypothetical protein E3N88_45308 [Mikania micrantha]
MSTVSSQRPVGEPCDSCESCSNCASARRVQNAQVASLDNLLSICVLSFSKPSIFTPKLSKVCQWLPQASMVSCRCSRRGVGRMVECEAGYNDEDRVYDDFVLLKKILSCQGCQEYRLTCVVGARRYAWVNWMRRSLFHPRGSPEFMSLGQALRLAYFSGPISLFCCYGPILTRFSTVEHRSTSFGL